jgi:hypothetical protein
LAVTAVVSPWAKFFPGFLAMAWVNMGPYPFLGFTGCDDERISGQIVWVC